MSQIQLLYVTLVLFILMLTQSQNESSTIKIRVSKGAKKDVFKDDIYVNNTDAQRLKLYIKENFVAGTK